VPDFIRGGMRGLLECARMKNFAALRNGTETFSRPRCFNLQNLP
jgi:hypothetical protein